MAELYSILRKVLHYATEVFFVDIQTRGKDQLPTDKPLLLAANHPNSIMDTVLLSTQIDRKVRYLARSGLFRNPVSAWIFDQCGAIPIQRSPQRGGNNDAAFARAYEVLATGGCVGIFPEGQNSLERGLLDLKTGAARIALGAESAKDFSLDLQLVPVGLNFTDRDQFMSSVLIRFGEPIPVANSLHV